MGNSNGIFRVKIKNNLIIMFHVPNDFRLTKHSTLGSTNANGNNGAFAMHKGTLKVLMIATDELGWEHVSVTINSQGKDRMPSWNEMCLIKDLFWDKEDCVVQFHPPESEYVNNHPYCLHLWRKIGSEFETPPSITVGIK